MVNQIIYDYLKRYSGQYKLEDLRRKILSKGYSEFEVDEVIVSLNINEKPLAREPITGGYVEKQQAMAIQGGFKWMRLSGIFGMLLLILLLSAAVYGYILFVGFAPMPIRLSLNWVNIIIFSGIFFVVCFLLLILNLGFLRLGKYSESGAIKFASRFLMVFIFLFLILSLGLFITGGFSSSDVNDLISRNPLLIKYSGISLAVVFGLIFICLIVLYSGLISIRRKVKFSSISGIFGWFFILGIIGLLVISLAVSGHPFYNISLSRINESSIGFYLQIYSLALAVLMIFDILFVSLSLLNASKQFE